MNVGIVVQQFGHPSQSDFDVLAAGACCGERHKAHGREEFIADSVIELLQQHLL